MTNLSGDSLDYRLSMELKRTMVTASFTTSSPKITEYNLGNLYSETDS
jgi:hypothetical protein